MIAAIRFPLSNSAEPETQGRLVSEHQRPFWNPEDPLERLGVGRHRTLHDLEADAAGLASHEKIGGLQLKALHDGDEDPSGLVWRIDLERPLVDTLPHDRREQGHHDAFRESAALLPA